MARICLVYLLEPELADSPLDEKRLSEFPLAHYAALLGTVISEKARGWSRQLRA